MNLPCKLERGLRLNLIGISLFHPHKEKYLGHNLNQERDRGGERERGERGRSGRAGEGEEREEREEREREREGGIGDKAREMARARAGGVGEHSCAHTNISTQIRD